MLPQALQLKSDRQEIRRLSAWVDRFAEEAAMSQERRANLQVALEELATNIIRHAYRESGHEVFSMTLSREGEEIVAVIEDQGPPFDPLSLATPETAAPFDTRPIGGLGIFLVRQLMDSVYYERRGAHNVLTLRCPREGAPAENLPSQ